MAEITELQIEKWKHEGDVTALVYGIRELEEENKQLKDQLESVKSKSIVKRQTLLLQTENKRLREQIDFGARAAKTIEREVGILINFLKGK